jgi:pimeloyl-ACP methyl ester carboxylesterase
MSLRGIAAVITMLLLAACGGGSDATSGESRPTPTLSPSSTGHEISGLVDIGAGRKVFAECTGVGKPTIVFESGDEADNSQWQFVIPGLAGQARTCTYDRLGIGLSDEATGCRRMKELRGVLEALLRALSEDGPYVLVGSSGGGYLIAGFAYEHSNDVVGMVLLDTARAIRPERAPAELLADLKCDAPANRERRDYVAVEREAWTHRHKIGNIPMTVISNDYGNSSDEGERANVVDQKGWLVLSPQARQVVVTSGHNVPKDESDLVVKEIRRVLDAAP